MSLPHSLHPQLLTLRHQRQYIALQTTSGTPQRGLEVRNSRAIASEMRKQYDDEDDKGGGRKDLGEVESHIEPLSFLLLVEN